MSRLARVVLADQFHLVSQRGNGRQRVFFSDDDYGFYLQLLTKACAEFKITCAAYVLMPNHVHLILVPKKAENLSKAMAFVHRAYAGYSNAKRKKTGHFWQGRFACVAMDNVYAVAALRYVLLNPVRSKLCAKPEMWPWSSAQAYVAGRDDGLTRRESYAELCPNIKALLQPSPEKDMAEELLRKAESIGRPLGSAAFLTRQERKLGRTLKPAKRGPKPAKDGE